MSCLALRVLIGAERQSGPCRTKTTIGGYVAANNTATACKELKVFVMPVNALAANKKGISAAQVGLADHVANEIKQTFG